jgi:hypothetical protein
LALLNSVFSTNCTITADQLTKMLAILSLTMVQCHTNETFQVQMRFNGQIGRLALDWHTVLREPFWHDQSNKAQERFVTRQRWFHPLRFTPFNHTNWKLANWLQAC